METLHEMISETASPQMDQAKQAVQSMIDLIKKMNEQQRKNIENMNV